MIGEGRGFVLKEERQSPELQRDASKKKNNVYLVANQNNQPELLVS